MTSRNWSWWVIEFVHKSGALSHRVVQEDLHFATRRVPFAISRNDDKSISPRRRAEDRCAANRQRLDVSSYDPHAGIIDAANLRGQLARQRQPPLSIRPAALSAAETPYRPTSKKIVGTQARHWVA